MLVLRPGVGPPPGCWSSARVLVLRPGVGPPPGCWSSARVLVLRPGIGPTPGCWSSARVLVLRPGVGPPPGCWSYARVLVLRPGVGPTPGCWSYARVLVLRPGVGPPPGCSFPTAVIHLAIPRPDICFHLLPTMRHRFGLTNLLSLRYFHWHLTRPLWIITDFSARRRRLPLVNHCGCVIASVGGLSGRRGSPSIDGENSCTRLI